MKTLTMSTLVGALKDCSLIHYEKVYLKGTYKLSINYGKIYLEITSLHHTSRDFSELPFKAVTT